MCTVTYLPTEKGYILTSSRDEYNLRSTVQPNHYQMYNQTITFPKDEKAGGTWIAASDSNRVACLLNGAFENFEHQDHYVISRGRILLDYFN
ncbi:MAG: NRDE family protein, partial [Saprospiraceae bacterium]